MQPERSPLRTVTRLPLWAACGALCGALVVAYFALQSGSDAQAALYQTSSVITVAAIWIGIRRNRPVRKRAWLLFSAGTFLWSAGDAYWDGYRFILHAQAPFPSPADALYQGAYPLLIWGVLSMTGNWSRPKLKSALDAAILAVIAGILTWVFLVEPLFEQTGVSLTGTLVAAATPVNDLALLVAFVIVCFRSRVANASLRFMLLGVAFVLLSDIAYSWLNLKGAYMSGMWIDAGWLLGYACWAIGALHPSMARIKLMPREETTRPAVWRIVLLGTAILVAPLALMGQSLLHQKVVIWEVATASILTTGLVTARVALLQRDRMRTQAALAVGERRYREMFRQADEARAALADQNDRLLELDHLKDNLISVVSHELRTPLTSIIGYLELLGQDRSRLTQLQLHFLEVVDRNADRLLNIVSDLLFMTQAEAGQLSLESEPVDLSEVVDEAVAAALPAARERQIAISVRSCPEPTARGDRARLGQVLDNLLSNALKFTPRHGKIEVRLSSTEDEIRLEVADTGIGIPSSAQPQLFSRFYRTDAAIEAAIQGTGLGLSILRAIVEAHGGQVGVESVEGEGATFRVTLPRVAAAKPLKAAA